MDVLEFQKLCLSIIQKIDKKKSIDRTKELSISQIIEELGELAKEVNRKKLRNMNPKKSDLEDEFADVILLLLDLAQSFDVNLEKSVKSKIETLKQRHNIL